MAVDAARNTSAFAASRAAHRRTTPNSAACPPRRSPPGPTGARSADTPALRPGLAHSPGDICLVQTAGPASTAGPAHASPRTRSPCTCPAEGCQRPDRSPSPPRSRAPSTTPPDPSTLRSHRASTCPCPPSTPASHRGHRNSPSPDRSGARRGPTRRPGRGRMVRWAGRGRPRCSRRGQQRTARGEQLPDLLGGPGGLGRAGPAEVRAEARLNPRRSEKGSCPRGDSNQYPTVASPHHRVPPRPAGLKGRGRWSGHGAVHKIATPGAHHAAAGAVLPIGWRRVIRSNANAVSHDSGTVTLSTSTDRSMLSGVFVPRVTTM